MMNTQAAERDELVADLDLALAALRRVVMRAIDGMAPANDGRQPLVPRPIVAPAKVCSPMADLPAVQSAPIVVKGISVNVDTGIIQFRDADAFLTRRQAQLAAVLAKASPNCVGRIDAARRAWPELAKTSHETMIGPAISALQHRLTPIGLNVVILRGVGIALRPIEGIS